MGGAATRHLSPAGHSLGKGNTHKIARQPRPLGTSMKRLVRKRIDCAPSTQRPDIVMGWLVHRDAFGGAVSTWPSPLLKHCPQLFEALHLSTRLVLPIYPGGNAREGSLWLSEDKASTPKLEVNWMTTDFLMKQSPQDYVYLRVFCCLAVRALCSSCSKLPGREFLKPFLKYHGFC